MLSCLLMVWLVFATPFAQAQESDDPDIQVSVQVHGRAVTTDAQFTVQATPQQAWVVLTDFDHMAEFVSNLSTSHILEHNGNHLTITQKGQAQRGPLSFPYDSIRSLDLTPFEQIVSHQQSGSMLQLDGTMWLHPQGQLTDIRYHSQGISNLWIPPLLGPALIASEIRQQLGEIRQEIIKRKLLAEPKTK